MSGGHIGTPTAPTSTPQSTQLTLRIGSMVSFQADGKLFDRNGIYPDVLIELVPEYFIGARDNVLEKR